MQQTIEHADTWEAPSMRRRRERLEAEAAAQAPHEQAIIDRLTAMGSDAAMRFLAEHIQPALYALAARAFGYKPGWASCRMLGDLAAGASAAPRRSLPVPDAIRWSDGKVVRLRQPQ